MVKDVERFIPRSDVSLVPSTSSRNLLNKPAALPAAASFFKMDSRLSSALETTMGV